MATQYIAPVSGTWAANSGSPFKARRFNRRTGKARNHSGNDLQARNGTKAVAVIGGQVQYAGHNDGYQWNAIVIGDDGNAYRYATHGPLDVAVGQRVEQGQPVGTIARNHLHFEVIPNGSPALAAMKANPGQFVSTSWPKGKPPLTIDPAAFFGVKLGQEIAAGAALGDPALARAIPEAPGDPFGVADYQRSLAKPNADPVSTIDYAMRGQEPVATAYAPPRKQTAPFDAVLNEAPGESLTRPSDYIEGRVSGATPEGMSPAAYRSRADQMPIPPANPRRPAPERMNTPADYAEGRTLGGAAEAAPRVRPVPIPGSPSMHAEAVPPPAQRPARAPLAANIPNPPQRPDDLSSAPRLAGVPTPPANPRRNPAAPIQLAGTATAGGGAPGADASMSVAPVSQFPARPEVPGQLPAQRSIGTKRIPGVMGPPEPPELAFRRQRDEWRAANPHEPVTPGKTPSAGFAMGVLGDAPRQPVMANREGRFADAFAPPPSAPVMANQTGRFDDAFAPAPKVQGGIADVLNMGGASPAAAAIDRQYVPATKPPPVALPFTEVPGYRGFSDPETFARAPQLAVSVQQKTPVRDVGAVPGAYRMTTPAKTYDPLSSISAPRVSSAVKPSVPGMTVTSQDWTAPPVATKATMPTAAPTISNPMDIRPPAQGGPPPAVPQKYVRTQPQDQRRVGQWLAERINNRLMGAPRAGFLGRGLFGHGFRPFGGSMSGQQAAPGAYGYTPQTGGKSPNTGQQWTRGTDSRGNEMGQWNNSSGTSVTYRSNPFGGGYSVGYG